MAEPTLADILRLNGGVATPRQLRPVCDRRALEQAVAAGTLVRVARGRYAAPGLDERVALARSVSGVLTGLSAAQHWGWSVKNEPRLPVVTVPRNRAVKRDDLDIRRRDVPVRAIVDEAVLDRAETVVDCARTLPFDEALAVADSALRDGWVTGLTREELRRAAAASPRHGRRKALRVVACADPRAANPFESVARAIALDVPGLAVVPQARVDAIGFADLVDPGLRLVLECESWEYHSGKDRFRHDIRRYTAMVAAGWTVVRFVWEDVMHRPDDVRRSLEKVVRRLAATDAEVHRASGAPIA